MQTININIGSVFNKQAGSAAINGLPANWISPYTAEQYTSAQKGTTEHPLVKAIADQLATVEIETTAETMYNAPSGCAVDIGAFLAGEPDCMINFDTQPTALQPLDIKIILNVGVKTPATEAAKGFANCFAAAQSIALTRPVTITPISYTYAASKKLNKPTTTVAISFDSINLSKNADFAEMALLADPRALREFVLYQNYLKNGHGYEPDDRSPIAEPPTDGLHIKPVIDGTATTYASAVKQILDFINNQGA